MFKKVLLAGIILALAGQLSFADRRSYVWTYEYATMPRGMAEIEYYKTLEYPDPAKPKVSGWKHQIELEYGLTDNWDISLYQMFKQSNTAATNTLSDDGYKLRTRYRVGERGSYPVDLLLYGELIEPSDLSEAAELEGKLILAKDIGRLNLSYNYIVAKELAAAATVEQEYAGGASLELNPSVKIGAEAKGSYSSGKHYLGPTLSLATAKFWINLGVLRGLGNGADQLQARLLLGIYL